MPISISSPSSRRTASSMASAARSARAAWSRVALRCAEHGEHAVADELVDVAAVLVHDGHDDLEQAVQRGHDLGRAARAARRP